MQLDFYFWFNYFAFSVHTDSFLWERVYPVTSIKYCFDFDENEFEGRRMMRHTLKRPSINQFIENFQKGHDINALIETFTNGNCYHFATILHNIYSEGRIIYAPIEGHFMLELWGRYFDITGEVSLEHTPPLYMDEECNDKLLYERLLRDCVYKLSLKEDDFA